MINTTDPTDKLQSGSSIDASRPSADLWKIREMYLSGDMEDKDLAYNWLVQLIGLKDANANVFILSFYQDWEDDSDCRMDETTWWKMKFTTYPVAFGKNYRYRVTMVAQFGGVELLNTEQDYGRYAVGSGQSKYDFCTWLCEGFRKAEFTLYSGLFAKGVCYDV